MKIRKACLAGLAGMAAAALLLTACQNQSAPSASPTGSAPSAQEQVVTGTATGMGEVTVELTVADGKILSATVDTSNETEGYGRDLGEQLAQQLMDAQSADIDGVSGCTVTSSAVRAAAQQALAQAGMSGQTAQATAGVYVGTARGAKSDIKMAVEFDGEKILNVWNVENGDTAVFSQIAADTVAQEVERNGFPGGDMGYSGGYIGTPSGNPLSQATGAEMSPEEVTEAMLAANPNAADFADPVLSLNIWQRGPATITGLMNRGFHLTVEDARVVALGDGMMTAAFTQDPVTGYRCGDDWYDAMTGAPYLGKTLGAAAEDAGVEIRLHTEATGLVIENNVCTGITVEDRESTYQINAKKVILATGYGGFDQESVETFYPEMSNVLAANNPGNHSDAQKWIKELGGEVIYYPDANYIVPVYNAILRDNYEVGWLFQKGHTMWVNSDGVRFFDESQILDNSLTDTGALLQTLDDGYAYMIFDDANTDCAQYAQELIEQGVAWSASTVEELAEKAGLPADALADTVAAYNEACASGTDSQFGTPADFMMPITGSPLYAARIAPGSTASMPLSVYVDQDMTITLTKGGQRIENLLAAGGVCGNLIPVTGFGAHVYEALSSGTYAGECARLAILGQ